MLPVATEELWGQSAAHGSLVVMLDTHDSGDFCLYHEIWQCYRAAWLLNLIVSTLKTSD